MPGEENETPILRNEMLVSFQKHYSSLEHLNQEQLKAYLYHCLDTGDILEPTSFILESSRMKTVFNIICTVVQIMLVLFLIMFLSIILTVAWTGFLTSSQTPNYERYIDIVFLVRHVSVSLGLPYYDSIKRFYDSDCLINNPYFVPDTEHCTCSIKKRVIPWKQSVHKNNVFREINDIRQNPAVAEKVLEYPLSFYDLFSLYNDHHADFHAGNSYIKMHSGKNRVKTLEEIFFGRHSPPENSIIEWEFAFPEADRHFRKILPRPPFILNKMEIALKKRIFFLHQSDAALVIDEGGSRHSLPKLMFYTQLWGEVNVTLLPSKRCICAINSVKTEFLQLQAGDMMFFWSSYFHLEIQTIQDNSYGIGSLSVINAA